MLKSMTAVAAAALFTSLTMSTVAFAETESTGVRFSDLDLATTAGQQQLDRRIDRAARSVCGIEDATTGTRIASRSAQKCYEQALRATRTQVAKAIEAKQAGA